MRQDHIAVVWLRGYSLYNVYGKTQILPVVSNIPDEMTIKIRIEIPLMKKNGDPAV